MLYFIPSPRHISTAVDGIAVSWGPKVGPHICKSESQICITHGSPKVTFTLDVRKYRPYIILTFLFLHFNLYSDDVSYLAYISTADWGHRTDRDVFVTLESLVSRNVINWVISRHAMCSVEKKHWWVTEYPHWWHEGTIGCWGTEAVYVKCL